MWQYWKQFWVFTIFKMKCHEILPGLVINTKDKNTFTTEMPVILSNNLIFLYVLVILWINKETSDLKLHKNIRFFSYIWVVLFLFMKFVFRNNFHKVH